MTLINLNLELEGQDAIDFEEYMAHPTYSIAAIECMNRALNLKDDEDTLYLIEFLQNPKYKNAVMDCVNTIIAGKDLVRSDNVYSVEKAIECLRKGIMSGVLTKRDIIEGCLREIRIKQNIIDGFLRCSL